jgi:hypothetical protein
MTSSLFWEEIMPSCRLACKKGSLNGHSENTTTDHFIALMKSGNPSRNPRILQYSFSPLKPGV